MARWIDGWMDGRHSHFTSKMMMKEKKKKKSQASETGAIHTIIISGSWTVVVGQNNMG